MNERLSSAVITIELAIDEVRECLDSVPENLQAANPPRTQRIGGLSLGLASSIVWVAIGILFIMYKGFRESLGSAIIALVFVAICVGYFIAVCAVAGATESMTLTFFFIAGLLILLVSIGEFVLKDTDNKGITKCFTYIFIPACTALGYLDILNGASPALLILLIPTTIWSAFVIVDVRRFFKNRR